ncbi:MAG: hypothetical protein MJE77_44630 [Proteobacteria bacterium]|nr:hypothetical protein [Pseudomonadota bacterium]
MNSLTNTLRPYIYFLAFVVLLGGSACTMDDSSENDAPNSLLDVGHGPMTNVSEFVATLSMDTCNQEPPSLYLNPHEQRFSLAHGLSLSWISLLALRSENQATTTAQTWGLSDVVFIEDRRHDLRAMISETDDLVLLTFRHTDSIQNWIYDAHFLLRDFAESFALGEKVHHGFGTMLAPQWAEIRDRVAARVAAGKKLWIFGHSLGAALAQLAAAGLHADGIDVDVVYASGAPKVGSEAWSGKANSLLSGRLFRIANQKDLIARVPILPAAYDEFGELFESIPDFLLEPIANTLQNTRYGLVGQGFELSGGASYRSWPAGTEDAAEEAYWTELVNRFAQIDQNGGNPLDRLDQKKDVVVEYLTDHQVVNDGYSCSYHAALLGAE